MLIVSGAPDEEEEIGLTMEDAVARVLSLRENGLRMKEAVKQVAEETGFPKNELYNAALAADAE